MKNFRLYVNAYVDAFVFNFIWVFILINLIRLLNFGLDCLDDCNAYDPNPLTLWQATYISFFTALVAGIGGIVEIYKQLHPEKKEFNNGDEK